ncbi:MAG: PASTA domain-containing protein [Candidatus Geothermincolia bacterium]
MRTPSRFRLWVGTIGAAAVPRGSLLLLALVLALSVLNTVLLVRQLGRDDPNAHAREAQPIFKVLVPDVSEMPLREAVELLDEAGLRLGRLFDGASADVEPEAILGQTPSAGAWSQGGAEVHLVVSAGRLGVEMADFTDATTFDAIARLAAADLHPVIVLERCPWAAAGMVIGQLPAAGSMLVPGQEVLLQVSGGRQAQQCWDCGGTGTIACPYCGGGLQRPVAQERACEACEALGLRICDSCEGFGSYVDVCGNCEGWGCKICDWRGTVTLSCEACGGEGAVTCSDCEGFGSVLAWEMLPCRECENGAAPCLTCGGDGWASW